MTLHQYLAEACSAAGLKPVQMAKGAARRRDDHRRIARLQEDENLLLRSLLSVEKISGLPVWKYDVRISGIGTAVTMLANFLNRGEMDPAKVAAEVKTGKAVIQRMAASCEPGRNLTVNQAKRIWDLVQAGPRPELAYSRQTALLKEHQRERDEAAEAMDNGELPEAAGGDGAGWKRACSALAKCVHPDWRAFRLKRIGPGVYTARSRHIDFTFRQLGGMRNGTRVTAVLRHNGATLMDRVVGE